MELKLEQTAPHRVGAFLTGVLAFSASKWLTSSSLVLMTIYLPLKGGITYKDGEEQRLWLKVEQTPSHQVALFPCTCLGILLQKARVAVYSAHCHTQMVKGRDFAQNVFRNTA